HPRFDRGALARRALKHRLDEEQVFRCIRVAIGKTHLAVAELDPLAVAPERNRLNENVLELAPVSARIHAQSAADSARNPAHELEPAQTRIKRALGNTDIECRRAGAHAMRRVS